MATRSSNLAITTVTEVAGMDGDTSPNRGRRGDTGLTFRSPLRYSEDPTAEGKTKGLLSAMLVTER